ncbi:hypothetical protein HA464_06675 [Rhizobium leguminosarum bv. trifolii]|uniref:hypothetical protein n=1 Tax=Rhizobium ruizarguesonis TaxID=2081791 RepID=UPI0010323542|nr:hypothetical protein [Rhizobium ruizarguesonis]QIO43715.1 hypothetical protein HA464_06675 [Rhizobium leguminosarum bv. trifolii]TBE87048.1 hypothetical protein ELG99_09405 [Rhizobium ruizarguesonis]
MKIYALFCTVAVVLACAPSALATCYDVSKNEPSELGGHLSHRIFAGPPNFEDVQKGDTPEPGYILKLDQPICITGDDFADPKHMFDEVQLVPNETTEREMARLRDTDVFVEVVNSMPAMTGHHHRPLLAWVKAISAGRDITESYGTAATTIEAFYAALHSGDGRLASTFVVPEKTKKGPFSAQALSGFYGSLSEPITLLDVHGAGDNRFTVRYRFRNGKKSCDGSATITTVKRDGRDFIQTIRAQNGC